MTVDEMADRVARLMRQRLGLRGQGLEGKLRHGGRALPGHIRAEAQLLADAARRAQDPRVQIQSHPVRMARAYGQCMVHLKSVNPRQRRWHSFLNWLSGLAFQLLLAAAAVIAILVWRGFL